MAENGKRPLPPSLTSEELREIQKAERKQRSSTIRRLLWEVFRLRVVARRADQLMRSLTANQASLEFNSQYIVVDCLREELEELPFLKEDEARRDRLV